ncbi:Nucleobase-ascorbate transporter 6 [Zea mays]|uniref:Nucleobase-ascorbate transporter 6 n=1 Tax=Zea mays TaxID=4577 RepID=A0A3L6EM06_MAIZE|nr:Nucleobase-ascorbate transporter 6 [Zea mays]
MAGGGGGGAAPKHDDFTPHPVKDQLPGVSYCITSPPPWPLTRVVSTFQLAYIHQMDFKGIIEPRMCWPLMLKSHTAPESVIPVLCRLNCLQCICSGVLKQERILQKKHYSFSLEFYLPHAVHMLKSIFDRFAVLFTIPIVWLYAYLLTVGGAYRNAPPKTQFHCRTDRSGLIGGAPWIRVPYPFQWGAPTFDAGEAFAMMAASFVALVESTGAFIAVSRYASATPIPPSVLSRGIGWQGIGILLDGLFGTGNGSSVSVENAGLLALTRVGSRRVVQISAGFMIFFSILGKFGAVFASIPAPIFAAMYCIFFAYAGSAGIGFLQFCNLNTFRTKFILGFSVFMGLSVPQYFNEYTSIAGYGPVHTHSRWFNDIVNVIFSSKAFVAGFVAYLLDNTIDRHEASVRRDRGYHWWDKFRSYRTDTRSEEFYSLPFNLNKFFPSV